MRPERKSNEYRDFVQKKIGGVWYASLSAGKAFPGKTQKEASESAKRYFKKMLRDDLLDHNVMEKIAKKKRNEKSRHPFLLFMRGKKNKYMNTFKCDDFA